MVGLGLGLGGGGVGDVGAQTVHHGLVGCQDLICESYKTNQDTGYAIHTDENENAAFTCLCLFFLTYFG